MYMYTDAALERIGVCVCGIGWIQSDVKTLRIASYTYIRYFIRVYIVRYRDAVPHMHIVCQHNYVFLLCGI